MKQKGLCIGSHSNMRRIYQFQHDSRLPLVLICLVISIFFLSGCSNPDKDYEKAFQSDNILNYQEVLKESPDHKRAQEARSRLGELLWKAAQQKPEIESLRSLISEYPKAEFTKEAEALLDDVSWQTAKAQNTIQSYDDYSASFPAGKFLKEARLKIEELKWQAAFGADSVEALENFLAEFPQSTRKNEAEQRIKYLHKQKYIKIFEQDDVEKFKEIDNENLRKAIREAFWWSPLLLAADTRSHKIAAYLIEKGADVNERGEDQATALHIAARSGALGIVKILLDHKAKINAEIKPSGSVITIGKGGSATYRTPPPTAKKGTPLHWAAYYNCPEVLGYLIQQGADVNADDGYGNTPVHFAAQSGSLAMIQTLIKAGADCKVKKKSSYGSSDATPLHYAKTVEVAKFFIKKGISFDAKSDLGQPIHSAAYFGHAEVIELLMRMGARINATCHWELGALKSVRATPLWIAASYGSPGLIDFLENKGGNIRYKADSGGSLIHAAAMRGNVPVIKHLIKKGLSVDGKGNFPHAHPFFRDWDGITPLGVAIHYGQIDAVEALLDSGADVNARFGDDWEPLSLGFVGRNEQMVSLLLEKGARITFPYADIDTRNTSDEIKELMKKHFSAKQTKRQEGQ